MSVHNIYRVSLDAKFGAIMETIIQELGYVSTLNGLTADRRDMIESLAEQAVLDWATERCRRDFSFKPLTNLQHLLNEYCALADHL